MDIKFNYRPGYRAGCKIAVVNEQGVVLETTTIWPMLRANFKNDNVLIMRQKKRERMCRSCLAFD